MPVNTYNFSISGDTAAGKVAPRNLDQEIRNDLSITRELAGLTILGDDLNIDFLAALDTSEEDALDAVVAAHAGEVTIKGPGKFTEQGVPLMMPEWRSGNPTDFLSFN